MALLPTSLRKISLFLERLPGIGGKTANRLAFYLLRLPDSDLSEFAKAVATLKATTKRCKICMNLTEDEVCEICEDTKRDRSKVTVIEDVLDLLSFETGNIYTGLYHVLGGKIDPLNHVGPDDIFIGSLLERVKNTGAEIEEVILATNPDMEGEATAMYIRTQLENMKKTEGLTFTITRLAYGLPMGGNLEYADYMTIRKSMEGRSAF